MHLTKQTILLRSTFTCYCGFVLVALWSQINPLNPHETLVIYCPDVSSHRNKLYISKCSLQICVHYFVLFFKVCLKKKSKWLSLRQLDTTFSRYFFQRGIGIADTNVFAMFYKLKHIAVSVLPTIESCTALCPLTLHVVCTYISARRNLRVRCVVRTYVIAIVIASWKRNHTIVPSVLTSISNLDFKMDNNFKVDREISAVVKFSFFLLGQLAKVEPLLDNGTLR